MNLEWSFFIKLHIFLRVIQLVCLWVTGVLRYQFSSVLGKAGVAASLASEWPHTFTQAQYQMLSFSVCRDLKKVGKHWTEQGMVLHKSQAILVFMDVVFQFDFWKCQVNLVLKQSSQWAYLLSYLLRKLRNHVTLQSEEFIFRHFLLSLPPTLKKEGTRSNLGGKQRRWSCRLREGLPGLPASLLQLPWH